ncbi:chlorophyllide a reductase iron protein subunit X [Chloroflexus sp.]|uniref:chlorophyllide a reductase iron protein subunit X n=1 Tax=Chloroflexus sp. TaxID=1904827 RepID=UPI00298F0165|nr:chlorophyllide a reductase iron protein subunit X [Chloroflexus sp.]MCS6889159.1 chlorophyllide a reductase iron protein subunit X [Chloroflexus sp.]MCX7859739.1 chlorophyllide a reductase iron protein subunit X [Chloroflexus sp.]MDW8404996.1 chlorophyllide a reductase iron protein subunit X [Chloroflexus sp.]
MPAHPKQKQTGTTARMLAVYGKGGMGKSFFTTNLVSKLALLGNRVLQLGCDPKHDSCNALFGGVSLPTLGDVWREFKEAGREEELAAHHVIFKTTVMGRATVYGCEIGGPEVGRGCGGRGITFGFDMLEKFGLSQWALDYVVMDFLGDVVCGGFATPLSRSLAEEVIILCGNDRQSLYAANNIASAAKYFASMGGRTKLLGLVVNRDDGSGVAARFAEKINLPVLASIPLDRTVRELADACKLALQEPRFDAIFDRLARQIIDRTLPAVKMEEVRPLEYKEFLSVFGAEEPDIVPDGATAEELFGGQPARRPAPVITLGLMERAVGDKPEMDAPTRMVVKRLLNELGMYVTEANHDPKKGMTLTVDGHTTICMGSADELDSKIAILAALQRSGEQFRYVDLRRPASPFYR